VVPPPSIIVLDEDDEQVEQDEREGKEGAAMEKMQEESGERVGQAQATEGEHH
jgi:hypothetical protein